MLDGKALLALDRWALARTGENVGAMLSGLLMELAFNQQGWDSLAMRQPNGDRTKPLRYFLTDCVPSLIRHYMQNPFMPTLIDATHVSDYIGLAERGINAPLDMMSGLLVVPPARRTDAAV